MQPHREHVIGQDTNVFGRKPEELKTRQADMRLIGIELRLDDYPVGAREEFYMSGLDVVVPGALDRGTHQPRITVTIHTNIGDRQGTVEL